MSKNEEQDCNDIVLSEELLDCNLYIIGKINEEMTLSFIPDLFNLSETLLGSYKNLKDMPRITITINTYGGELAEMFAMYDAMKRVQKRGIIIETLGLGKVMSSGLLLLAAGTKGFRTLGKYTRLMFHEINGELIGTHNEINEQKKEIDYTQEQYINALCVETKKSRKFFENHVKKHIDIHLTAEEGIEWNLADHIEK